MQFRVSTLFILTAIVALLVLASVHVVTKLQDGDPNYEFFLFLGLTVSLPLFPFIGAGIGYVTSRNMGIKSHIPGIALGVFGGFLLAFSTIIVASYFLLPV